MFICFDNKKFKINKDYDSLNDFYTFTSLNDKNEIMATLTYKIKDKKIWIYKISTKPNFYKLGASKALIYALENFAFKKRISYIEGKFYPDNEFAKPFYEKLGYEIYKVDYETFVGKYLFNKNENVKIIEEDGLLF